MNRFKMFLGVFVFAASIVAAYSFTYRATAAQKAALQNTVWIKYSCDNPDDPQALPGGNTLSGSDATPFFTEGPADCGGNGNLCAVRVLTSQTKAMAGQPAGNLEPTIPLGSIPESDQVRCLE